MFNVLCHLNIVIQTTVLGRKLFVTHNRVISFEMAAYVCSYQLMIIVLLYPLLGLAWVSLSHSALHVILNGTAKMGQSVLRGFCILLNGAAILI